MLRQMLLRQMLLSTLAVLFFIPIALAKDSPARTVDERHAVALDGRVEIECISGNVDIRGGDAAEIHVTGLLGRGVEKLNFDTSGNTTRISLELPRNAHDVDVELTIVLPSASRLSAESVSAGIRVTGLTGAVELESVSGDLTIEGDPRSLQLETVSGDMHVTKAEHLAEGSFESVSGDIELQGSVKREGRLGFETVSGDVVLQLSDGTGAVFDISTFSGRIRGDADNLLRREHFGPGASGRLVAGEGGARISIETFSGNLEITGIKLRKE